MAGCRNRRPSARAPWLALVTSATLGAAAIAPPAGDALPERTG
jgi:hypothetical protein